MTSFSPVAATVPFDNTSNGFIANDVQAAIEEVNNRGFSVRIVAGQLRILSYEEMILSDYMDLLETGSVDIDGLLTILGL